MCFGVEVDKWSKKVELLRKMQVFAFFLTKVLHISNIYCNFAADFKP